MLATLALLFTGVTFAQDGTQKKCCKGNKECCKKSGKCCKKGQAAKSTTTTTKTAKM